MKQHLLVTALGTVLALVAPFAALGILDIPDDSGPAPCVTEVTGSIAPVETRTAADGRITGTTTDVIAEFADRYNSIRIENCLTPIPLDNFRHDLCMEDRLIWIAEDPSDDPLSAWGHIGVERSDGVPDPGCDGNLAGGSHDDPATVADRWWSSAEHRESLYNPGHTGPVDEVCVHLAMTRGGVGTTVDERPEFLRATARWGAC